MVGPFVLAAGWGVVSVGCATLRGGFIGVVGTLGGWATVSGVGATEEKLSASLCMAAICLSPIGAIADAGEGFWSAQYRSMAARIAASAEESCGIAPQCGKNSTVLAVRSVRVLVA